MKPLQEILNVITHSSGTKVYHTFSPIPDFPVITDGVLALAESVDCYWLLEVIGNHQNNKKVDKAFQVWNLNVNTENGSAVIQGYNDTVLIVTQKIPYTDFPLGELKLYLIGGVIMLPSEY